MSATAPVFNPSSLSHTEVKNESGGESSAVAAAMAAGIAASRVTKPLPNSRRPAVAANFAPVQAAVPKSTEAKENTRRLIVVLSQVC